ncbi:MULTISPECIES: hypothetical protein [unclassified Chitinophaga]|uniref:hypothetical protein n=1 Tax=unclassified Chitinophaga TaxID=2619133 RepID=UPI0009D02A1D|nr:MULTISPECIES: hypothetical protein [unclassified Chitinophaga]OMP77718.1 hypothetical protein BW716_18470 [[Flexibacter] sp. ATCC 35208]WPV65570.1 hypothetical protein QQL36_27595 [Chitinophaga sp. LS1]
MALPYSAYKKKIQPELAKLSPEQLLFVGVWTAEYLDRQYGPCLDGDGHARAHEVLQDAIGFLWNGIDDPSTITEADLKKQLRHVRYIDIDDLDFAKPKDCGILKLMEAVESTLSYAKEKKPDAILTTAWFPMDVLNAVKDSEFVMKETPPKYKLDDPFFAEELESQTKLFAHLQEGKNLTSKDKTIFR